MFCTKKKHAHPCYQDGADESPFLFFLQEIEEVEVIHLLQSVGL